MTKRLLTEWISVASPDKKVILESISDNKELVLDAILQRADAKNQNGRIYPRSILDRELKKYQESIKENRALGELDHPESGIINLSNVSHMVLSANWNEKNEIVGKIKILNTPAGNIIKNLLADGVLLGVSSRGMGSTRDINETTVEVLDDFELICWDMVSTPSTQQGWARPPVSESKLNENIIIKKNNNIINKLINDIISSNI